MGWKFKVISTDKLKNSQKENRNQSGQRWASQLRRNPQRHTPVPPVLRFETGPLRDRLCHTTVPAIFNYTFIISILRISPKHPIISNITMTNETHLKRADGHLQRETWMLPGTSKEALPVVGPKSGSEFPGVQTLDCDSRNWAAQIKAHGKRREPLFGGSQGEDSRDVLWRRQEENWRWAKSMVMERSPSYCVFCVSSFSVKWTLKYPTRTSECQAHGSHVRMLQGAVALCLHCPQQTTVSGSRFWGHRPLENLMIALMLCPLKTHICITNQTSHQISERTSTSWSLPTSTSLFMHKNHQVVYSRTGPGKLFL